MSGRSSKNGESRAKSDPAQSLNSVIAELSCAVGITTTPLCNSNHSGNFFTSS